MANHTENWDGATPPAAPSGWTFGGGITTVAPGSSPTPISGPNTLKRASGAIGTVAATWGTPDANSGNVAVMGTGQLFSGSTLNERFSVFARGSASSVNFSSSTFYEAQLKFSGFLTLNSVVSGTSTAIGSSLAFTASTGEWYRMTLTCNGTTITITVQRVSDGFWLNSSGNFNSPAATAITRTDSSISGAGYAGWYAFAPSADIFGDDWSLTELGASVTAALNVTGGNDVFAGSATDTAFGSLSATGGNDIFAGSAPITRAALSATAGNDTAAIAGWCIVAGLGVTEHHDTLAGSGGFAAPAVLSRTGGSDVLAGLAGDIAAGSIAAAAGNDTAAMAGMLSPTGHLSAAGGGDVLAAAGRYGPQAALGGHGGADSFSGGSSLTVTASMGVAERGDSFHGASSLVEYHVYSNTNAHNLTGYTTAAPIDYSLPIATTGLLTWTSSPLGFPGTWRFAVRAFDPVTSLEEENLDAAVTIILDASGVDITNRPKAPTALRAFPRAGGTIRVEWAYNTINPAPVPTGFHVYKGTGGVVSYGSPAATVSFQAAIAGSFVTDLTGLVNGTVYTIGVRAYNSTAEEPNTVTVNCAADATGPAAVVSLSATAII